jgi:hypothetical protein
MEGTVVEGMEDPFALFFSSWFSKFDRSGEEVDEFWIIKVGDEDAEFEREEGSALLLLLVVV